jgi:predicted PurR-regulated permease PerM
MNTGHARRAVFLAAVLVVAGLVIQALLTLLLALVVAIILALPLAAAADRAQRAGLPRVLGAVAALALIAGVLSGLGLALVPAFIDQAREFAARLPSILHGLERALSGLGIHHTGSLSAQLRRAIDGAIAHPSRLGGPLSTAGTTLLAIVVGLVVIAVVAVTLAVRPEPVLGFLMRLVPAAERPRLEDILSRIRSAWLGWMTAVAIDMVVLGGLLWVGMALIGLPFAVGFATFSALMTIIPNYGSVISAVPPILAGLSHSPSQAALVLVVYLIVNQIEGNLILPLIMARTVDMHPAVVAIGLLVVAALFGIIGVFIAIPLLSVLFILVQALWIEPQERAAGGRLTHPAA